MESSKATVQLRSKLIPEEHVDELANTYDPDLIKYGVQCSEDLGAYVFQQHRVGRIPSEKDDSLSIKDLKYSVQCTEH